MTSQQSNLRPPPPALLEARRLSANSARLETIHSPTRVVVMGKAGVGKTAIIKRFLDDEYSPTYQPTVEDMYTYTSTVKNKRVEMEILDTSGFYSFPAMRKLAIASGKAFILVYSLDQKDSFKEICGLRAQIVQDKDERLENDYRIFVVRNKCDLDCSGPRKPTESFLLSASKWQRTEVVKTSAKENTNIKPLFELIRKNFFGVTEYRKGSKTMQTGMENTNQQIKKTSGFSKKFRRSIRRLYSRRNRNRAGRS